MTKDQVIRKQMAAKIRDLTNELKAAREDRALFKDRAEALRARHDRALDCLADLSQGLGLKPAHYDATKNGWDTCMKHMAGLKLAEISKMRLP